MSEKAIFDDETLESMMTDYRNGMSFLDLSLKYGSTHTTIRKYLRLHGCEGRRRERERKRPMLRGEKEFIGIPSMAIIDDNFGFRIGDHVTVRKSVIDYDKGPPKIEGEAESRFHEVKIPDQGKGSRRKSNIRKAVVVGITKYDIIVQYFLRNGKLGYREAIGKTRLYSFRVDDSEILEVTKVEG